MLVRPQQQVLLPTQQSQKFLSAPQQQIVFNTQQGLVQKAPVQIQSEQQGQQIQQGQIQQR